MQLFIDSSALVALNDIDDPSYRNAQKILQVILKENFDSLLSTNIILESTTLISQKVGKAKGISLLDELRGGKYTIINPDDSLLEDAEEIFRIIRSKNVSYSDCVSFAVMKHYDIKWAFAFDDHFKKQGFKRIGIDGKLKTKLEDLRRLRPQ